MPRKKTPAAGDVFAIPLGERAFAIGICTFAFTNPRQTISCRILNTIFEKPILPAPIPTASAFDLLFLDTKPFIAGDWQLIDSTPIEGKPFAYRIAAGKYIGNEFVGSVGTEIVPEMTKFAPEIVKEQLCKHFGLPAPPRTIAKTTANYTLRIRLQQPIPGVDHLQAIDAEKFANLHGRWDDVASLLDVDRINDLYVYEGENGKMPIKWHRAAKGLEAVRAILDYYESGKGTLSAEQRREVIEVFRVVESVLDDADLRGIRFCFVGNY